jgi:hypothetical protein
MLKNLIFYYQFFFPFNTSMGWVQWFMAVIPATQEVEIGRITVQGQPGQKR